MDDIDRGLVQDARVRSEAWTPMTNIVKAEQIARTREDLQRHMATHSLSNRKVANALGVSPTAVSQFVNDKYTGDQAALAGKIIDWLDQEMTSRRSPKVSGFVETEVALLIRAAFNAARKHGGIALAYGPSGIGKTMTAAAYAAEHPRTIFVRVTSGAVTARGVLNLICDKLRLRKTNMIWPMIERVVERIGDSKRMVIIDEAHRLGVDALEAIRDIHDMTECPMVLLGTEKIAKTIDENNREARDWITDQFGSRICLRQDILGIAHRGGKPLFTVDEIRRVFRSTNVKLATDAGRFLGALAGDPGLGGLRMAKRVLLIAAEHPKAGDGITGAMVRAAYRKVTGGLREPNVAQAVDAPVAATG